MHIIACVNSVRYYIVTYGRYLSLFASDSCTEMQDGELPI